MGDGPAIGRLDATGASKTLIGPGLAEPTLAGPAGFVLRWRRVDGPCVVPAAPGQAVVHVGLSGRVHTRDGSHLGPRDVRIAAVGEVLQGRGELLELVYPGVAYGPRAWRFGATAPLRTRVPLRWAPTEVLDLLSPRDLYPVVGPVQYGPGRFALQGPPGLVVVLAHTPRGTGPALHVHTQSTEMFVVLGGRFRVFWGDHAEDGVELGPLDHIVVPTGLPRGFTALTDDAWILPVVVGVADEREDILWPPAVVAQLERVAPPGLVPLMRRLGLRLAAR
ncbi:MAG: putative RmlC-like cupin family protein [Myxococcota bacterium]|jgi:uncharacterized RmlC-like cupin family protein